MLTPPARMELSLPPFLRPGDLFMLPIAVHSLIGEELQVEVILRGKAGLNACQARLDGAGWILMHPFLGAGAGGFEGDLSLHCHGVLVERTRVRVPDLKDEPEGSAPTADLLRTSHGDGWRAPLEQGARVERRYEDSSGRAFPHTWDGWDLPLEASVTVRVSVVGWSGRAVRLVDPLPAGMEFLGWDPGGSPSEIRCTVQEGRVEFQTSSPLEEAWTVRYSARMTTPGVFVLPPARAEDLTSGELAGRTGWDLCEAHPELEGQEVLGLSLVEWGPQEIGSNGEQLVSYILCPLDGAGRQGSVSPDGSAWERTSEEDRDLVLLGRAWSGLAAPPLLAPSPLGALGVFLDMWGEKRVASPKRKRKRLPRTIACILPRRLRVREGLARRIRARLRHLGCPLTNVAKP